MDKNVRFIFKVLLGTAAIVVIGALFIEFLNISLMSLQLQQMTKTAARQACVLFSQETYKERDNSGASAGTINMDDLYASDGTFYLSGDFYIGSTAEEIYANMYDYSSSSTLDGPKQFKNFLKNTVKNDEAPGGYNWYNIGLIYRYMNTQGSEGSISERFTRTVMPDATSSTYLNSYGILDFALYNEHMNEYTEYALGKSYYETLVTPLNFGVPYLDKTTLQSMFRWNLTQILSNCNSAATEEDNLGEYYVGYSGYRVYANTAQITNLEYKVFDLNDSSDKLKFENMTHIDPDKLAFSDDITYMGTEDDERRRICVVGIEYSVEVGYSGVTWLSPLLNWVSGMSNGEGLTRNAGEGGNFNDKGTLEGGGLYGDTTAGQNGILAVPGKLIYYVVR